jgi:hypothetical protein
MIVMSVLAIYLAVAEPDQLTNVFIGAFAIYLVSTGWSYRLIRSILTQLSGQRGRRGALLDPCTAAGTDEQPSFPSQFAIGLRHGVEMHPDIQCQSPHGRQRIAGGQIPIDQRHPQSIDYLAIDWGGRQTVLLPCKLLLAQCFLYWSATGKITALARVGA